MKTLVLSLALACAVGVKMADAATVMKTGAGNTVTKIDRSVEYTGLTNGTPFADYHEDGVFTTHPTDVAKCQGNCGIGFGFGTGEFYYSNGFDGYVSIRTTDGLEFFGIELQIGSGFSLAHTTGHWEAFKNGSLTGSGEYHVEFGTVLGFSDMDLFDELRIASYRPSDVIPTLFDPDLRQTTAMDNVYMQLNAPVAPVPIPAGLPLLVVALGCFALVRHNFTGW